MGQIQLFGPDAFVCTPYLYASYLGNKKLGASGTACRLTFHAVQTVFQNSAPTKSLIVEVWRAKQSRRYASLGTRRRE